MNLSPLLSLSTGDMDKHSKPCLFHCPDHKGPTSLNAVCIREALNHPASHSEFREMSLQPFSRVGKGVLITSLWLHFVENSYNLFGKSPVVDVHIKLNDLDRRFDIFS
jgi:hypothetical protein